MDLKKTVIDGTTVVYDDTLYTTSGAVSPSGGTWAVTTGGGLDIDYTTFYTDMVAYLKTISENTTAIKNDIATIKTDIATLTANSTEMKNDIDSIKTSMETMATLSEGSGIHMVRPHEWEGGSVRYKSYRVYPPGQEPTDPTDPNLYDYTYGVQNVEPPAG